MGRRVAIINGIPYGSTGSIVRDIKTELVQNGDEVLICLGWTKKLPASKEENVRVGSFFAKLFNMIASRITGFHGCFAVLDTHKLIKTLENFNPDIICLHILHCWNVNLPMLFKYLRKSKAKIVWTMHDCWAFTGQCPHYQMVKCDKWKMGCHNCEQYRLYPQAYLDNTRIMWALKRKWFTGIDNLRIVAPSKWMEGQIKQSFMKDYPVRVINNGINLDIFTPTNSNIRKVNGWNGKIVLLGVAFDWGKRKGLDVFNELATRLDKEKYQVVLVGLDRKNSEGINPEIQCIPKTENQKQLVEIYSAADIFVNPTREDTFPTVNMEAIACGLPVITFDTGGSPEIIGEHCGSVVECDRVDMLIQEIANMSVERPSKEVCLQRAKSFDKKTKYKEYIDYLYE